jgi:hypothetical protein
VRRGDAFKLLGGKELDCDMFFENRLGWTKVGSFVAGCAWSVVRGQLFSCELGEGVGQKLASFGSAGWGFGG